MPKIVVATFLIILNYLETMNSENNFNKVYGKIMYVCMLKLWQKNKGCHLSKNITFKIIVAVIIASFYNMNTTSNK